MTLTTSAPLDLIDDEAEVIPAGLELRSALPAVEVPEVHLSAGPDWIWAIARTERLVAEVAEMLGTRLNLPRYQDIELMGRRRLAREIGLRLAEQATGYAEGWRYHLRVGIYTLRALAAAVTGDAYVWSNDAGEVDVLVLVNRARQSDHDYGAILADALTRATLAAGYTRARHLYPAAIGPEYSLPADEVEDLRGALCEAEAHAAQAAADEWRERFQWLTPAADRARELLHRIEAAEQLPGYLHKAQQAAEHWIALCYSGENAPEPVSAEQIDELGAWIFEHGTDAGYPAANLAVDRAARLNAAAWLDYQALRQTARMGEPEYETGFDAGELAEHLFHFDERHRTARSGGQDGTPAPYWYGRREWRGHVRDEWRGAQAEREQAEPASHED